MTGFSEQWLAEHQAKMAALKAQTLPPMPDVISFSIDYLTQLPNVAKRGHIIWSGVAESKKLFKLMEPHLSPYAGRGPMQRAHLKIVRFSVGPQRPDHDNLVAAHKRLSDLLLVRSAAQICAGKETFGIIVDDSDAHLTRDISSVRVPTRLEQRTEITITALPPV